MRYRWCGRLLLACRPKRLLELCATWRHLYQHEDSSLEISKTTVSTSPHAGEPTSIPRPYSLSPATEELVTTHEKRGAVRHRLRGRTLSELRALEWSRHHHVAGNLIDADPVIRAGKSSLGC